VQAAASETVLIGALGNVRPGGGEGVALVGRLRVEGSLLGYGAYSEPIMVRFPAAAGKAEGPGAGRYLLFLKGDPAGDGFTAIDAVRLTDAAVEAKARTEGLAALGSRHGTLTTVQATLAEWEDSWNARDLDRCIRCYSGRTPLRARYEAGGKSREELAAQVASFRGKVGLSIRAVRRAVAPSPRRAGRCAAKGRALGGGETEGEEGPPPPLPAPRAATRQAGETADVEVEVVLSAQDLVDHRRTTMKLVREGEEWLILDEGF
jgi:hypothetical protein